MWALNVHRFWRAPNTCMYRCCTPANTSGDQQVVHTNLQVAPSSSYESVARGRGRITCRDHAISNDVRSQRARSNMEGGQVDEVPTIFHPRRSLTSNVIISEDQRRNSLLSPIQIVVELIDASGKSVRFNTQVVLIPSDALLSGLRNNERNGTALLRDWDVEWQVFFLFNLRYCLEVLWRSSGRDWGIL